MRYIEAMDDILVSLGLDGHTDYIFDRGTLEMLDSPGAKWLWIVKDAGTNLFRIGVHEKESLWAKTVLLDKEAKCYLLEGGQVKAISTEEAYDILGSHEYAVRDNKLFRGDECLAEISLERKPTTYQRIRVDVRFAPVKKLSLDDLTALHFIAISEGVNCSGVAFGGANAYVGSVPLMQFIEAVKRKSC